MEGNKMKARVSIKLIKGGTKEYPNFEGTYTLYNCDGIKLPLIKSGIKRLNQLDALIDATTLLKEELESNDLLIY
jgi:hypothetical protein